MPSTNIVRTHKIIYLLITVITSLIVIIPSYPQQGKDAKKELTTLVERYITGGESERITLLEQIKVFDTIYSNEIAGWIKTIAKAIDKKSKHDKKDGNLHHPKYPIKYALIGDTSGKKLSLLVALHGGGADKSANNGQWKIMQQLWKNDTFTLLAVPRVWDDSSSLGWNLESGIESVIAMIDELKRTYPIDTNSIYLEGDSMGAWGVYSIGTVEADHFAALFVNSGGYSNPISLPNLLNTPIAIYIGEKDTHFKRLDYCRKAKEKLEEMQKQYPDGYKLLYKEIAGKGHDVPKDVRLEGLQWLKKFSRNPLPKHVIWEPVSKNKKHFYWLKIDELTQGMRIEAEIKDKVNVIIKTKSVSKFTLFLNDKLVDFNKPIKVEVNGAEKYNAKLQPSLTAILESYVAKEDAEMIFTARVEISN